MTSGLMLFGVFGGLRLMLMDTRVTLRVDHEIVDFLGLRDLAAKAKRLVLLLVVHKIG
jgi:hypothetical protein